LQANGCQNVEVIGSGETVFTCSNPSKGNSAMYSTNSSPRSVSLSFSNVSFVNFRNCGTCTGAFLHVYAGLGLAFQFENVQFENCSAAGGGCLSIQQASIYFANCSISYVRAYSSQQGGGFLYLESGSAAMVDSTLKNCSSIASGGCIVLNPSGGIASNMTLSGSSCVNSISQGSGGCIIAYQSYLFVNSSVFRSNSAVAGVSQGGSLICSASQCIFQNITCRFSSSVSGGCLSVGTSTIYIDSSLFEDNYAQQYGGSINLFNSNASISNSVFQNCSASTAGALVISGPQSYAVISVSSFVQNLAQISAGAILFDGANHQMFSCIFQQNTAFLYYGGAIYLNSGNQTIVGCHFLSNVAPQEGGAVISFVTNVLVSFEDCLFIGNIASHGGAISQSGSALVVVHASRFINNFAHVSGGALNFVGYSTLMMNDSHGYGNCASAMGGIGGFVFLKGVRQVSFNNASIENSSADAGGFVGIESTMLVLNFCNVSNCSANSGGAIVMINEAKVLLDNSSFSTNEAKQVPTSRSIFCQGCGGVLYVNSSSSSSISSNDVNSVSFISNSATLSGGAIFIYSRFAQIAHAFVDPLSFYFVSNSASYGSNFGSSFSSMVIDVNEGSTINQQLLENIDQLLSPTRSNVLVPGRFYAFVVSAVDALGNPLSGAHETIELNLVTTIVGNGSAGVYLSEKSASVVSGYAVFQFFVSVRGKTPPSYVQLEGSFVLEVVVPKGTLVQDVQFPVVVNSCPPGEIFVAFEESSLTLWRCHSDFLLSSDLKLVIYLLWGVFFACLLVFGTLIVCKMKHFPRGSSPTTLIISLVGGFLIAVGDFVQTGAPTLSLCYLSDFCKNVGLVIMLSVLYARSYRYAKIFNNKILEVVKIPVSRLLMGVFGAASLQALFVASRFWLDPFDVVDPYLPVCTSSNARPHLLLNSMFQLTLIFVGLHIVQGVKQIP
jgi:predicted outer membrane repeat protein